MQFNVKATKRDVTGTGASRRLRNAGTTPGIIYGGDKAAVQISLDHNDLFHALRKEAFHSSVLNIEVDGSTETAVLRDVQWHPFRQIVLHIDFQRVDATHVTHIKVPVHFINHDVCPGVKLQGGVFSHTINELDLKGLPGKLPAFIEVDMKDLNVGGVIHLSDIKLPEGVELAHATEGSKVVASIVAPRGGSAEPEAGEDEAKA
ncbi:50S ribosomal protein L25/general stress protein Ctc [Uliginosibacterium sp. 31-16]|uniref:50S ribosomal protein L25/general stress protein Ctc n=1 Tax=Uliginosibacterium sp. 31-16 TaxID=3068315 RepID=UPI00273E1956|nr:50S ribosomal protein L25/general stress protein Ctc [Uliginosibacterium sp. 31-16]MDP5241149.1 50S ribosomal protein L25/general stress protein Ctc [Uliginosibacterium sp. 31-16]